MELGIRFVEIFRWILLLVFTLLLEKGAEGITFLVSGDHSHPQFDRLSVLPFLVDPATRYLHWGYLTGVFQFATTILFAARYFICLVDPFERVVGFSSGAVEEDLGGKLREFEKKHKAILLVVIVAVVSIALLEFIFLFHAATAFRSYEQWASFLVTLVLVDSVFFFLILPRLYGLLAVPLRVTIFWLSCKLYGRIARKTIVVVLSVITVLFRDLDVEGITDSVARIKGERKAHEEQCDYLMGEYERKMMPLKDAAAVYGPWNALDVFVLLPGLAVYALCEDRSWVVWLFGGGAIVSVVVAAVSCRRQAYRMLLLAVGGAALIFVIMALLYYYRYLGLPASDVMVCALSFVVLLGTVVLCSYNLKTQPELWSLHLSVLTHKM